MLKEANKKEPVADSAKKLTKDTGELSLKERVSNDMKSILNGEIVIDKPPGDWKSILVIGAKETGRIIVGREMAVKIENNSAEVFIDLEVMHKMAKYIKIIVNELPESTKAGMERGFMSMRMRPFQGTELSKRMEEIMEAGDRFAVRSLIATDPKALEKEFWVFSSIFSALLENRIKIDDVKEIRKQDKFIFDELRGEKLAIRVLMMEKNGYSAESAVSVQKIQDPEAAHKIFLKYGLSEESKIAVRMSRVRKEQEMKFWNFREKWSEINNPELRKDELKKDLEELAGVGIDKEKTLHYLRWYSEGKAKDLDEREGILTHGAATVQKMPKDSFNRTEREARLKIEGLELNNDRRRLSNLQKTTALVESI